MSLIHNEQTKLTATYLNGLAMAIFAIGAVAPVVTIFSGGERGAPLGLSATVVVCLSVSGALHYVARRTLKGLRP